MKKLLLTLSFILLGLYATNAQVSGTDEALGGPRISFSETLFDYGNIPQSIPAKHEFKFTNTGETPLLIISATAACGCTVPKYTEEPIMPGKTGVITVVYNAANLGSYTKTVNVKTNASKEDVVLTIRVNVVENK